MRVTVAGVPDADPFAPVSAQFALAGASFTNRRNDVASRDGVRPWGLRRALPAGAGRVLPTGLTTSSSRRRSTRRGVR